ncbi:glycogen-binding subunit 76A-like [Sitophilus oryzae]|uniref:Glycogen-binding subunit 76A-like n=1 Tax=Sitophilus oryzae TaxID=7048 RepID=A0A6J2YAV9_SITOR|nr:glycogen-binding subunit 76A-like [Sitophilus oryzae]
MTSKRDNCGLSSLIPLSCRDRAEAFAKSLQTRLSTLGSQNDSADERSWLGNHEKPLALSQPLHNPETDRYLELEALESPCSPQEELEESEFHKLLNNDSFKTGLNGDCHCKKNGVIKHHSVDSDSEVFYDLDDDPPTQPYTNGIVQSESSKSLESETGIDVNSAATSSSNPSDTFATSLDCTPQPSVSDDLSTLSLKDDCSQVEDHTSKENGCEQCNKNREDMGNEEKKTEFLEVNGHNDENFSNGHVECFVSNLTVINELVVECRINSEDDATHEPQITEVIVSKSEANGNEDDDDDDNDVIPRVRRCSSLKTGKTPPGTPGRKKIVRFADVLGLDLADVRTFLDEIPKVPKSAYDDLSDVDISDSSDIQNVNCLNKFVGVSSEKILVPLFEQPSGLPNFLDLVRENQVCLENALVDDPVLFLIRGTVRVRNLDFNKSVHIRYTLDSWKTFADVQASYVQNSCDGFSDRFSFVIYAHTLTVGQKLEFACRFQCKGCQYWDSNKGLNYCFQCLPAATSSTTPVPHLNDWGASFY